MYKMFTKVIHTSLGDLLFRAHSDNVVTMSFLITKETEYSSGEKVPITIRGVDIFVDCSLRLNRDKGAWFFENDSYKAGYLRSDRPTEASTRKITEIVEPLLRKLVVTEEALLLKAQLNNTEKNYTFLEKEKKELEEKIKEIETKLTKNLKTQQELAQEIDQLNRGVHKD